MCPAGIRYTLSLPRYTVPPGWWSNLTRLMANPVSQRAPRCHARCYERTSPPSETGSGLHLQGTVATLHPHTVSEPPFEAMGFEVPTLEKRRRVFPRIQLGPSSPALVVCYIPGPSMTQGHARTPLFASKPRCRTRSAALRGFMRGSLAWGLPVPCPHAPFGTDPPDCSSMAGLKAQVKFLAPHHIA